MLEYRLVVQALRLNTLSKLTFADSKRFDSLVKDVFPGVNIQEVEYAELETALKDACKDLNVMVIKSQVSRIEISLSWNNNYCQAFLMLRIYHPLHFSELHILSMPLKRKFLIVHEIFRFVRPWNFTSS